MKPRNIKKLYVQSKDLRARTLDAQTIAVASASNPAAEHIVTINYDSEGTIHAQCSCPWANYGGVGCSHVMAALEHIADKRGRKLSFWQSHEEARRQKHRMFCLIGGRNREGSVWITSRTG